MKRFSIDTNFNYLGPWQPALSHTKVCNLNVKVGEHVVVFQDDDEWDGTVMFDAALPEMYQWYVEITARSC